MTNASAPQQFEFKAEVKQVLDILIHSLYTNKEIFLRELISNASDALDKLRFETARGSDIADAQLPLEIRLTLDKDRKLLTIADTGVGMTEAELIADIGTIAKSGSAEYLKQAVESKENLDNIIGKFGVGFYSVFMAAEEVIIRTRSCRPDQPARQWRSDGQGAFEITALDGEVERGTVVEVHLKEEAKEFADPFRVKEIIKKHSNFISFPIYVDGEQVNTVAALWRESKFSVKPEQYQEFYKFMSFDADDPLTYLHVSVDAPVQYNSLLFIPPRDINPFGFNREYPGLDLYVHRVLIQKGNRDLIPEYLGFVRGVVDSEDLPLNVSRETLQENAALSKIAGNITKQILTHLDKIAAEDADKYATFWKEHGRVFKLGYNDYANRDRYAELLRFNSSRSEDAKGLVSLAQYMEKAQEGQSEIYYVAGASREAIELNPHMDIFKSKGIEVLYLYDPFDEFAMDALRKYKEWDLKSVEHVAAEDLQKFESVESRDEVEPLSTNDEEDFKKFLDRTKEVLGERVTEVRVSSRLSGSPCCLVSPDGSITSTMQRILQIAGKDESIPRKIFEVNKDHKLIRNLFEIFKSNPQDYYLTSALEQLYDSSLLMEGYLKDPHAMVRRIQGILDRSSGWYLAVSSPK